MPETIQPGDLVQLKSGGSIMTVEGPNQLGNWVCSYFQGKTLVRNDFPAAALSKASKADPPPAPKVVR